MHITDTIEKIDDKKNLVSEDDMRDAAIINAVENCEHIDDEAVVPKGIEVELANEDAALDDSPLNASEEKLKKEEKDKVSNTFLCL